MKHHQSFNHSPKGTPGHQLLEIKNPASHNQFHLFGTHGLQSLPKLLASHRQNLGDAVWQTLTTNLRANAHVENLICLEQLIRRIPKDSKNEYKPQRSLSVIKEHMTKTLEVDYNSKSVTGKSSYIESMLGKIVLMILEGGKSKNDKAVIHKILMKAQSFSNQLANEIAKIPGTASSEIAEVTHKLFLLKAGIENILVSLQAKQPVTEDLSGAMISF